MIEPRRRLLLVILELLRYVQSVCDHTVEQLCEVLVFDDECRAKPLEVILSMLVNPVTRPLSERPNERKCALRQNPDVSFGGWAVHCSQSAFANSGSDLNWNQDSENRECVRYARKRND